MARNYDLIKRLQEKNERPTIQITEELTAKVDTSKTKVLHMEAISRDEKLNEGEKLDKIIDVMLGKTVGKEIAEMDLSIAATQLIIEAIGAAIGGEDLEEVSERFQEQE